MKEQAEKKIVVFAVSAQWHDMLDGKHVAAQYKHYLRKHANIKRNVYNGQLYNSIFF